ncbi:MAG: hypothetical protein KF784_03095 [Fimbriimonadaceae bacterium]|nr:hypothetical protein [Fimbriimonadaceae bacterium]
MTTKTKIWLVAGASILGVTGYVAYQIIPLGLWGEFHNKADVAVKVARMHELPLTQDELMASLTVPSGENAAADFLLAEAEATKIWSPEMERVYLLVKGTPEERVRTKQILQGLEPAFEHLREGAKKKGLVWEQDWDAKNALSGWPGRTTQRVAGMLAYSTILSAEAGRFDQAIADLKCVQAVANLLAQDGSAQAFSSAQGLHQSVWRRSGDLLAFIRNDAALMARVEQDLLSEEPKYDLHRFMQTECYLGIVEARNGHLWLSRDMERAEGKAAKSILYSDLQRHGIPKSKSGQAAFATTIYFWADIAERFKEVEPDLPTFYEAVQKQSGEYRNKSGLYSGLGTVRLQIFDRSATYAIQSQATRLCHLALYRVMQSKKETGKLPKTLSEVNAEFVDPFAKKPLRYIQKDGAVMVYSVGSDLVDHGGVISTPNSRVEDIVAYCPL